ncbi:MAG: T9SS type A sorting domain-containing protein [Bacteroidota bacterium]
MKKLLLISALSALSPALHAQVTLTGTSYTQNFDALATGLPTGWTIADSARANFMGHLIPSTFFSAATYGTFGNGTFYSTRGGFKNFPSADVIAMGSDSMTQVAATDRALGVRQVTSTSTLFPNSDPGAAFLLQVANTTGFKTFTASFKLQSLDTSSPRTTTWRVDYGTGATPTTWTNAGATGTLTTGNRTFSNNTINVNFGTALDNKTTPVWIRIVTIDTSTGSGNRATTAIDDFTMSWLPIPSTVGVNGMEANNSALTVVGNATPGNINMQFTTAAAGDYKLVITDVNGRISYNRAHALNTGSSNITINADLAPGMYFATMAGSNSAATTRFIVK